MHVLSQIAVLVTNGDTGYAAYLRRALASSSRCAAMIAFRIIRRWLPYSLTSIILFLTVLLVAYYSLRAVAVLSQGYAWSEIDWNSDGATSIQEFFESSDVGKRIIVREGRECVDYFAYKDGLTVRLQCR